MSNSILLVVFLHCHLLFLSSPWSSLWLSVAAATVGGDPPPTLVPSTTRRPRLADSTEGRSPTSVCTDKDNGLPILSIRDQFNQEGYVVLKDFFNDKGKTSFGATNDKGTLSSSSSSSSLLSLLRHDWFHFATQYWNRIFQVLHDKGEISQPRHVMNQEYITGKLRQPGYKEIVHRYPGRYELSLSFSDAGDAAPTATTKAQNVDDKKENERMELYQDMPALQPIIDQLEPIILSILKQHPNYKQQHQQQQQQGNDDKDDAKDQKKKYNVIASMLIAAPGCQAQKFHVDTKHLHSEEHYPAHIINVFIPLVDVTTEDLGPTALVPQSHVETRLLYNPQRRNQAKALFEMERPVQPLLQVGDVLLFDFRILHRGLANTDVRQINRPFLVLAFSIPSFQDTANWPGPSIFD